LTKTDKKTANQNQTILQHVIMNMSYKKSMLKSEQTQALS